MKNDQTLVVAVVVGALAGWFLRGSTADAPIKPDQAMELLAFQPQATVVIDVERS